MSEAQRMFPIQRERGAKAYPTQIPWSIAELAYSVYSSKYGKDQSLERLAERHGFAPSEMDEFLPDWRERCDEIKALRDECERYRKALEYISEYWNGSANLRAMEDACNQARDVAQAALTPAGRRCESIERS